MNLKLSMMSSVFVMNDIAYTTHSDVPVGRMLGDISWRLRITAPLEFLPHLQNVCVKIKLFDDKLD